VSYLAHKVRNASAAAAAGELRRTRDTMTHLDMTVHSLTSAPWSRLPLSWQKRRVGSTPDGA
jgi:DNA polymerase/3'-5' exonuclease PolX